MQRKAELSKTNGVYFVSCYNVEPIRFDSLYVTGKPYTDAQEALTALQRWVDDGQQPY